MNCDRKTCINYNRNYNDYCSLIYDCRRDCYDNNYLFYTGMFEAYLNATKKERKQKMIIATTPLLENDYAKDLFLNEK